MATPILDCGELAIIQKKIDDFWMSPRLKDIDKIPMAGVASALLQNQDVTIGELASKNKHRVISVEWNSKCDVETQDCSDDCEIDGEDVTPECDEVEVHCLRETSFKMAKRAYRDKFAEFSDNFALNVVKHKKALIDWLNVGILQWIAGNAGVNQFTGGVGDVVGGVTTINPAHWDENIWGYFVQVLNYNQFSNAYMLSGNNLYQQVWNGRVDGNTNRFAMFNPTFDMRAFSAIGADDFTFLVHKTAGAFINKAWNPLGAANAVEQVGGQYLEWSDALGLNLPEPANIPGLDNMSVIGLPDVFVDITLKETCEDNDFFVAVKMKLWGEMKLNPQPCNDDVTGILAFECSA